MITSRSPKNSVTNDSGVIRKHPIDNPVFAWSVIISIPMISLVILIITAFNTNKIKFETGDHLLDQYLYFRIAESTLMPRFLVGRPGWNQLIFDDDFEPLAFDFEESPYRDDPRFWMAGYRMNFHLIIKMYDNDWNIEDATIDADRSSYLFDAYDKGIADSSILINILRYKDGQWREEAGKVYPQDFSPNIDRFPIIQQRRQYIDEKYGKEQQHLVNELLENNPDQAFAYYEAMAYEAERGNMDQAFYLLRQGNQAKDKSYYIGFPYGEIIYSAKTGCFQNDPLIKGLLGADIIPWYCLNAIRTKNVFRILSKDAAQRRDLEDINDLYIYACNLLGNPENNTVSILAGLVMFNVIRDNLTSGCPELLTPEVNKNLAQLDKHLNHIKNGVRNVSQSSSNNLYSTNLGQLVILTKSNSSISGKLSTYLFINSFMGVTIDELYLLETNHRHSMEEIRKFDYTTLSWNSDSDEAQVTAPHPQTAPASP